MHNIANYHVPRFEVDLHRQSTMTSIQLLLLALATSAGLTMQARLKVRNVIIIYAYSITVYTVHLVVI